MKSETSLARTTSPNTLATRLSTACAVRLLLLLLLALPAAVQAQWNYTTNHGTITITGYTGPGGAVTIPSTITGLPVTSIGTNAFYWYTTLTNVTVPNGVTNIGDGVFTECYSLTSVTIPNSVIHIGDGAFYACTSLTNVTIPNSVTSIGDQAFYWCTNLTNVTIPHSVRSIGVWAFANCINVEGFYFVGNAPNVTYYAFAGDNGATLYYLPGTTGWDVISVDTSLPTALWTPQVQSSGASFGVKTNQFGFNIIWASGMTVVVEASTNLANSAWRPLATNTLSGGSAYFSDPAWTNYPSRFYRLRWP